MRIALLTDGIWPYVIGGMQKHSFYLCKYLARKGIQIDLYYTADKNYTSELCKLFSPEEIAFINPYFIEFPKQDKLPGHYLRASKKYSFYIAELLERNGYADIIYAKGMTAYYLLHRRERDFRNIPICINVHGYEYFQKTASWISYLQQLMIRPIFTYINLKADYIYSYGGGISELIKSHIKNSENKIIEVPSGINKNFISPGLYKNSNIRKLIFVGRNERRKGIAEIQYVLRKIDRRYKYEFHFVGDISIDPNLKNDSVFYHGIIKDSDKLKDLLMGCDVLVCPSYSEGMPNVIMEAMACGCAIIASNVGAINLLVDARNGWLITPGSKEELASSICTSIDIADSEIEKLQKHSLKKIKEFTWEEIADMKICSFENILKSRNLSSSYFQKSSL